MCIYLFKNAFYGKRLTGHYQHQNYLLNYLLSSIMPPVALTRFSEFILKDQLSYQLYVLLCLSYFAYEIRNDNDKC